MSKTTRRRGYLGWQKWIIIFVVGLLLPLFGVRVRAQAAAWSHQPTEASVHTGGGIQGDDGEGDDGEGDDGGDDSSDDHGSDDSGSDDSSDDHGSDDSGSDDSGSDDSGDDHGSDDSSDDHGSDDSSSDDSSDDHGSDDSGDDSSGDDGTPDQGSGDAPGTGIGGDDGTPDQGSGDAPGTTPSPTQRTRGSRSAIQQTGTVNAMPAAGRQGIWRIDGKVYLVTRHTEMSTATGTTGIAIGQCVKLHIVPGTSSVVREIEVETAEHCATATSAP